jgi:serine/threonine-protein phosphatase 2A activator
MTVPYPLVRTDAAFRAPAKKILSESDVGKFTRSKGRQRIVWFVLLLNDVVQRRSCLDEDIPVNDVIAAILRMLDQLAGYVDEVPPSTGPRRFGNVAFREWIRKMEEVRHRPIELTRTHPDCCALSFQRKLIRPW